MKIVKITASKTEISLSLEEKIKAKVLVREQVPTVPTRGRDLSFLEVEIDGDTISLPRFGEANDRIWSQFEVWLGNKKASGVKYVTDFDNVATYDYPYPQPNTIQAAGGLGGVDEDINLFGSKQSLTNVNLTNLMAPYATEDTITYVCDGKEYYFNKSDVRGLDYQMRKAKQLDLLMTFILLNAPQLFNSKEDPLLLSKVIHPRFDDSDPNAFISAFNMVEEEGQNHFKAFVEFMAERYTNPDSHFGLLGGFIVSNEIGSQYVWGNAGEMTCQEYTREYSQALRLAWIAGRKHASNFRVYTSLDHYWHGMTHSILQPMRYYDGKSVLDNLNAHTKRDGDFDWHVAHHPYPENLAYPDFYNDRTPGFHFLTPRITFKNIEVLPAYLSQEHLCYRGKPRRIILSEQGFNSRGDAISEAQAAAAYCLAYLKIEKIETIDLFTHHAYIDNQYEFGLNLGIRRRNDDGSIGEAKPIFDTIVDLNNENREKRIGQSRDFIGHDLFDSLLNPEVVYGGPILKGNEGFGAPLEDGEEQTYEGM